MHYGWSREKNLKPESRGTLALHRGKQRGLSEVKRRPWSKWSNIAKTPKVRFSFCENKEIGLTQRNGFSWSFPLYQSKEKGNKTSDFWRNWDLLCWDKSLLLVDISDLLHTFQTLPELWYASLLLLSPVILPPLNIPSWYYVKSSVPYIIYWSL